MSVSALCVCMLRVKRNEMQTGRGKKIKKIEGRRLAVTACVCVCVCVHSKCVYVRY